MIIDGKGRLFGKINIIDFLAILFLVCLLPMFYYGYKIFNRKPVVVEVKKEYVKLDMNCLLTKLDPEVANTIRVGDSELDEHGEVIGEIVSLGQVEPYMYEFDIGGSRLVKEDENLKQIGAGFKLKLEKKGNELYYKDNVIKNNSTFKFEVGGNSIEAIVNKVRFEDIKLVEIEKDCLFINVKPKISKLISVGDKELNVNGEVIGEIVSLGQVEPYLHEIDMGSEQKLTKEDSILKQIPARLRLKAEIRQNNIYYNDKQIAINSPLVFKTSKYSITGIYSKEEEEEEERFVSLNIKLNDLDEDTVELISVGDREIDKSGETVAEVLAIGKLKNSTFRLNLGGENFITGESGDKKQLSTKMRLKCQMREDDNQLYYNGKKVLYNEPLYFQMNKYKVMGLLVNEFEEEEEEKELIEKTIDMAVILKGLSEEVVESISVGDKELDEAGNTIAEILSVGKVENSTFRFGIGSNEFVIGEDAGKKQISVLMRMQCQTNENNQIFFKGINIEYNKLVEFKTDKYKANVLISKSFLTDEEWVSLRVKFSGVIPEIAFIVHEGDIETDGNGNTIAKITSIISNNPSEVLVVSANDTKFVKLKHPFNKEIICLINVLCIEKEGEFYFKNQSLKIGKEISFSTGAYSITGLIVGIEIK